MIKGIVFMVISHFLKIGVGMIIQVENTGKEPLTPTAEWKVSVNVIHILRKRFLLGFIFKIKVSIRKCSSSLRVWRFVYFAILLSKLLEVCLLCYFLLFFTETLARNFDKNMETRQLLDSWHEILDKPIYWPWNPASPKIFNNLKQPARVQVLSITTEDFKTAF